MRPAIFLDRDGVLNRAIVREGRPYSPRCIEEFEVLSEAPEACRRLQEAGFLLIVVTNQPDVARDCNPSSRRRQCTRRFVRAYRSTTYGFASTIRRIDADVASRRRGMLIDAAKDWNVDFSKSFIIGDRSADIEAGHAVACRPVLIDRGYEEPLRIEADYRAGSLTEAVDWILRTSRERLGQ